MADAPWDWPEERWRRLVGRVRDDGAYLWTGRFQLVMHPHVIGYRSRIWILKETVRHAKALGDVWFATHRDVAAWARAHAGAGHGP